MNTADFWIDKLNLCKDPEGGYFKEVYRSDENLEVTALPKGYTSDRSFSTSIYFLLKSDVFQAFIEFNQMKPGISTMAPR